MESDLDVIGRALRHGPPPRPAAAAVRSIERAWLAPLAVAAAVLLAVALRFSHRSPNLELASGPPPATSSSSDTGTYAEEVSEAMFDGPSERRLSDGMFDFAADSVVQRTTPEASALQAALEAGSACTSGRLWNGDCNDYASALFF